jgi:mannose-1-phosphate guanylyltransferase
MDTPSGIRAVILAGGSGQRFWPLSRELNPKQLLSMFGTESLISAAIRRVLPFTDGGAGVSVVTSELLFDELRNHLTAQPDPELHKVRYIQEPLARNTAPAIALAAATLIAEDPDAVMIVLPSDHMLEDGHVWADCIEAATSTARAGDRLRVHPRGGGPAGSRGWHCRAACGRPVRREAGHRTR